MTSAADQAAAPSKELRALAERMNELTDFASCVASLKAGHGATIGGVWGSSCALVSAALAPHALGPLVVVAAHGDDLDDLTEDLRLFSDLPVERFSAWEGKAGDRLVFDEIHGERLRLLKRLAAGDKPPVIVTSIQSLLQPTPGREAIARGTRRLNRGDVVRVDELAKWLVENGFENVTAVEMPGEFSLRGGILDVFAADWFDPVRVEFFGDEIESIRRFEVATQRSLAPSESAEITVLAPSSDDREHFTGFLPSQAWVVLIEPAEIEEEGRRFFDRLDRPEDFHGVSATMTQLTRFPSATLSGVPAGSMETTCHLPIESVERFSGDISKVRDELDQLLGKANADATATTSAAASDPPDVFIVCPTDAEAERLTEVFRETRLAAAGKLHFPGGRLKAGFRLVRDQTVLVSAGELFLRADLYRPSRRHLGRVIDSFLELREGDYVVHLAHGIGRYRGLKLLERERTVEEHLVLEFHGETKIYVPVSKIDLVQKYVGGSKTRPTLAHIGGKSWTRQKEATEQAVNDLAADMLELQASRATRPGIAFIADSAWQREFDASFPYTETPDQRTSIASIKKDMEQPRPMDRLLCGDVGFGKTELAMRAAFKAVDTGYQVALLAPTTILAEQHLRSFKGRFAEFPFAIRSLSRFSTAKQQRVVLEALEKGSVDIVIGTHRLAQADVKFHNLGLLIIDEEQRFGVEVKDRLKAVRSTIDVLTMTATPIPRTLHLSLLGVRDISNLETPPPDRMAIETRVTRFDPDMVRHAILRELNRGGQAYYVHNRIKDIQLVASKLQAIVPEARIGIGHGQMPEGQLERIMLDFVDHKFDVLLATTIVESGLDIPNANTIFIDEADRYGLADLHQLRGRVGRFKHRAYCYLLIDPARHLSDTSAKRLRAIEEFSDIGAGFAIAMRDLELRGAGNILGSQQSGHIATVGYELYCDLLEQAIRRQKKMPPKVSIDVSLDLPGQTFIPRSYVPDMRMKIDLYRRMSRLTKQQDLDDFSAEMADRFGPRPPEVDRMLLFAQIRIWAHAWQIRDIHLEDAFVVFAYARRKKMDLLAAASGGQLRIVDDRAAYLPLPKSARQNEQGSADLIVEAIKSILRPA